MNEADRLKYLKIALVLVGIIFIAGIYPLMIIWPSGWSWHMGHSDYPLMIVGIYATLGVFLIIAARNPLAHLSLIWFTVWSSVVHGGIMTVQALANNYKFIFYHDAYYRMIQWAPDGKEVVASLKRSKQAEIQFQTNA